MSVNGPPRILICTDQPGTVAKIRNLLAGSGCELTFHLSTNSDPGGPSGYKLILVDGSSSAASLDLCRRLRERLDSLFIPVLYVSSEPGTAARSSVFEAGADAYLARPFAAGELLAQVHALFRVKEAYDRLAGRSAEMHRINKRLQQLHQQIDHEMQLAQRIQASFLPQSLPDVPHGRFAVHYLPRDRVGGDFYDVFRLDENHVGLYVADVMGHGVPASLLTIFVKKGVQAKEVFGRDYRLVPPEEVLQRLNSDLIDQSLSEHPFITMTYALYDHRASVLRFARAGHPYPLYVPHEGTPSFWRQEGLLLGVADTTFPARSYPLKPGDKVLLYSDGIDGGRFEDQLPGATSLLAWARCHQHLPIQKFIDGLARDLFVHAAPQDDVTLLGLEVL
jgi:serine phosphatase RsbU (regulator of sigma subunit)